MLLPKIRTQLALFMLSALIFSCQEDGPKGTGVFSKSKFEQEEFADALEKAWAGSTSIDTTSKILTVSAQLKAFYVQNSYKPLWLEASGNTDKAMLFLEDLEKVTSDAIDPERYQFSNLKKSLEDYRTGKPDLNEVVALDTAFTFHYLRASHDLLFGLVLPKSVDSLWFHANDSAWKTDHVVKSLSANKYPSLDSFRSNLKLYAVLKNGLHHYQNLLQHDSLRKLKARVQNDSMADNAIESIVSIEAPWLTTISDTLSGTAARIQAFQQYYGIKRTGKLDSTTRSYLQRDPQEVIEVIAANMERVRWLPREMEQVHVMVNIPTMDFAMKREGNTIIRMNVVVGKPSRQTPTLNAKMANIVINPPWGVPPTILKKDVLPGILKSGSGYLRKKGLEAFDHKGRRIEASAITASNYKRYTFRQPPGHSNALGYIKFNFPNKWDIYMHDTPHREDFEKFDRARSSGCIRLQHPQDLARYILSDMEGRNYGQEKLDSVIAAGKTKWETLQNKIPVHIIYLTASVDESEAHIRFARDFYERDAKLMAAISR